MKINLNLWQQLIVNTIIKIFFMAKVILIVSTDIQVLFKVPSSVAMFHFAIRVFSLVSKIKQVWCSTCSGTNVPSSVLLFRIFAFFIESAHNVKCFKGSFQECINRIINNFSYISDVYFWFRHLYWKLKHWKKKTHVFL